MTYRRRIANSRVWALWMGLTLAAMPLSAQDSLLLRILPIQFDGVEPSHDLNAGLVMRLRGALQHGRVRLVDAPAASASASGRQDLRITICKERSEDGPGFVYRADVVVLLKADAIGLEFFVLKDTASAHEFAGDIADRLSLYLGKAIRVAMLEFPATGTSAGHDRTYSRRLPTMLASRLGLSSGFVLVESGQARDTLARRQRNAADAGIIDPTTAVRLTRGLGANYYIMGEYWELGDALRVDVRAVSLESFEVIAIRGITISPVTISTMDDSMAVLGAELREAIASDHGRGTARTRYLAVTSLPPIPNTRQNRALQEHVVHTLSRKLRACDEMFRVRDAVEARSLVASNRRDRWYLSRELEADLLLSVRFDRSNLDRPVLDLELFDALRPRDDNVTTDSILPASMDADLNRALQRSLTKLQSPGDTTACAGMDAFPYHHPPEPKAWLLRTGVSVRREPSLFLDAWMGGVASVGFLVTPVHHWPRVRLEPNISFDAYGARSNFRRVVIGTDVSLTATYRLKPYQASNPYFGGNVGALGVLRLGSGSPAINATPALGVVVGNEFSFENGKRMTLELLVVEGLASIGPVRLNRESFPSGRPGAIRFTVGWIRGT
jgi:hypothetical protein